MTNRWKFFASFFQKRSAFLCLLLFSCGAFAVEPRERLENPALEARARDVSRSLRCLVCRNESIDESGADLARDLRVLLRERINAGDSDEAARQFIVARYGDFVLLRPPVGQATVVLWFGPFVLLAVGAALLLRRRPQSAPTALSKDEAQRLRSLMDDSK